MHLWDIATNVQQTLNVCYSTVTATLKKLTAVASKTIKEDNADVLILGCMSMAFHDITLEIQNVLNIPVINPVKASLLSAESLVKMGISHSKIAFPTPSIKKIY